MTSRYRGYDDYVGPVTVWATYAPADRSCGDGREPWRMRVTRGRKVIWKPDAPLCYYRGRGRESAARVGFDFFAAWSERTRGGSRSDPED